MVHYYAAFALLMIPALAVTVWSGFQYSGGNFHLGAGLLTAVLCVATQTLLILFMILTGRILKAAMKVRPLSPEYLTELNHFFAEHKGYPVAIAGALSVTVTAVLGYGPNINVPSIVHISCGIVAAIINIWSIRIGISTIKGNQNLLDRVSAELDKLDEEIGPAEEAEGEIQWVISPLSRFGIYAVSAWLPYLYWGFVVWKGDFGSMPKSFLILTAIASIGLFVYAASLRGVAPGALAEEE
jgi:hypothetical protein